MLLAHPEYLFGLELSTPALLLGSVTTEHVLAGSLGVLCSPNTWMDI
jgi:hypothetical protein